MAEPHRIGQLVSVGRALMRIACLVGFCVVARGQDPQTISWLQGILNDWEQTCRQDLRIAPEPLPWIIVFDETRAWHIHPDRQLLPKPTRATPHAVRFGERRYKIYEVRHTDKLWVPDRPAIELAPMAVAMPYAKGKKAYFVLGTPEFMVARRFTGESPQSPKFRNVLSGLAMHELAHTRQLPQLMPLFDALEKKPNMPESIDDNLVENTFSRNPEFKALFDKAAGHLQRAVMSAENDALAKEETRLALRVIRSWQERFFVGKYEWWIEMDDAFLTLEGAGQWVLYRHAVRKAPPGQPWQETLVDVARSMDSWSQSLGLGLFLLMDRFVPDWSALYFSKLPPPSPIVVLERAVGISQQPVR
jgi:hypothetical protein